MRREDDAKRRMLNRCVRVTICTITDEAGVQYPVVKTAEKMPHAGDYLLVPAEELDCLPDAYGSEEMR